MHLTFIIITFFRKMSLSSPPREVFVNFPSPPQKNQIWKFQLNLKLSINKLEFETPHPSEFPMTSKKSL